jgi:hypothetical protein
MCKRREEKVKRSSSYHRHKSLKETNNKHLIAKLKQRDRFDVADVLC